MVRRLRGATCSVVFQVREGDRDLVLKVPHEGAEERNAFPAMRAFSIHGGVEVIRSHQPTGAVLMPLLVPGRNLFDSGVGEEEAVPIAATLIQRLRRADPVQTVDLKTWYRALFANSDGCIFAEAREVASSLLDSIPNRILLHGDLHHFNILRHGDDWIAIDPKGILGDPSFEIASFMINPMPNPVDSETMRFRLTRFAELLGDPVDRLWGWAFSFAVLSHLWERGADSPSLRAAQELRKLRSEFYRH